MQGATRIFVYGTLRKGGSNHGLLAGATFAGLAETREPFAMFDLGGFPCIVPGGEERVAGEVFLVDGATLARLDALEDVPRWYRRAVVLLADGSQAEAYLYAQDVGGAPRVPGGDWMRRRGS
jgi:gamma-glutamylaminecyclotransferase